MRCNRLVLHNCAEIVGWTNIISDILLMKGGLLDGFVEKNE